MHIVEVNAPHPHSVFMYLGCIFRGCCRLFSVCCKEVNKHLVARCLQGFHPRNFPCFLRFGAIPGLEGKKFLDPKFDLVKKVSVRRVCYC